MRKRVKHNYLTIPSGAFFFPSKMKGGLRSAHLQTNEIHEVASILGILKLA